MQVMQIYNTHKEQKVHPERKVHTQVWTGANRNFSLSSAQESLCL